MFSTRSSHCASLHSHKYHGRNPESKRFFSGIKDDIGSYECVGNPFWEESANFITLATKVMISAEGMKAAKEAEAMGAKLSNNSSKSRLENQSGSMYGNNKRKQPALSLLWLQKKDSIRCMYFSQVWFQTCHSERHTLQDGQDIFGCETDFIPVRTKRDFI